MSPAPTVEPRPAQMTRNPPPEQDAKLVSHVRELCRLRSEQRAAEAASALAQLERTARVHVMLRDTHSRNP